MQLYRTTNGFFVSRNDGTHRLADTDWDQLWNREDLPGYLAGVISPDALPDATEWLAPIGTQEVWAAGVTYFRCRTARM